MKAQRMPTIHQIQCTCIFLEFYPWFPIWWRPGTFKTEQKNIKVRVERTSFYWFHSLVSVHTARTWKIPQLDAVFATWVIVVIVSRKKPTIATCLLHKAPCWTLWEKATETCLEPLQATWGPREILGRHQPKEAWVDASADTRADFGREPL